MLKKYRKIATVMAKIFENGDEDGFIYPDGTVVTHINNGSNTSINFVNNSECNPIPYISTLENQFHRGEFLKNYICTGINGERWLVEKSIFEETYEEILR